MDHDDPHFSRERPSAERWDQELRKLLEANPSDPAREDAGHLDLELSEPATRDLAALLAGTPGAADRAAGERVMSELQKRLQAASSERKSVTSSRVAERGRKAYRMTPSMASRRSRVGYVAFGAMAIAAIAFLGRGMQRAKAAPDVARYSTRTGQTATVRLPDGSRAMLAPETTLEYSSSNGRLIEVQGEALFTVIRDDVPFVVRAGGVDARVLGTTFDVRHYAADSAVRIVVAEGRVAATSNILSTGDVATTRGARMTIQHAQDVARPLAWTQGTLAFADVPLGEAARDVARWYGIELRIRSAELRALPVTGSIGHEPAREVVAELTTILGLRARWLSDSVVEITK